jgi:hypothetical protein
MAADCAPSFGALAKDIAAIEACRAAAAKSGKEETCTITVAAP